jgi:hypothetical protein
MQRASDCDIVLAHDDDLVTIDGLGHDSVSGLLNSGYIDRSFWQSLESLEPEVMMDLLRKSKIDVDEVFCGELLELIESWLTLTGSSKDLPPTDSDPSADTRAVKVAMVSMKLQNLNSSK